MRVKRRTLPAAVCALIVLALTASMALAAYYGKGNFKDVFVNRKNCFNSDLLAPVSGEEEAKKSSFQTANGRAITICNYDLSTGEYNGFPMEFSLYAWLDKDVPVEQGYELKIGSVQVPVNSTDNTKPIFQNVPLEGNKASECIITVFFNADANLSDYPRLYLYAIPTQPDYMMLKRLGGCLIPTKSTGFTAEGHFDLRAEANLEDYAAFPYEVTMSGRLEGRTGYLKIEWDAAKLSLMSQYNDLPVAFEIKDGAGGKKYILLPLAEEYYARLTFLRVQDPAAEEENPWENAVTAETLESFVKTSIVE